MKLSTKILIAFFVLTLVPAIWLGQYFIAGIIPTGTGFSFKFSALGITGIVFMILNTILGSILYFRFLRSLSLSKTLFFSIMPLTVVYGVLIFLIADIAQFDNKTARSIKAILNLSDKNIYNTVLWAVLISIVYVSTLFLVFLLVTKPVSRMEKIVNRLSDGKVKDPHFKLGGGKQFKELEHSLNKINYNFHSKDGMPSGEVRKNMPKEYYKILDKNAIGELELGGSVKKNVTLLFCSLGLQKDKKDISLDENFDFVSSYSKLIYPIIRRYNGALDKYFGEGILAIFSKPENALDCAHQIAKEIEIKNKSLSNPISISIALHTDEVAFGMLGNEKSSPAIISDTTFIKKQSQINTLLGTKLVFTKRLLSTLPTKYRLFYRYVGSIKNGENKVAIFESMETYPKDKREKLAALKADFENGVKEYNDQNYQNAKSSFAEVLRYVSDDKASYVYYNKACDKLGQT